MEAIGPFFIAVKVSALSVVSEVIIVQKRLFVEYHAHYVHKTFGIFWGH